MIKDHQVQRRGDSILLGIAVQDAVMDIQTDEKLLHDSLRLLRTPHKGLVSTHIGRFGEFIATLNLDSDNSAVSIFIDGPDFQQGRSQSAAIWTTKDDLCRVLCDVLQCE